MVHDVELAVLILRYYLLHFLLLLSLLPFPLLCFLFLFSFSFSLLFLIHTLQRQGPYRASSQSMSTPPAQGTKLLSTSSHSSSHPSSHPSSHSSSHPSLTSSYLFAVVIIFRWVGDSCDCFSPFGYLFNCFVQLGGVLSLSSIHTSSLPLPSSLPLLLFSFSLSSPSPSPSLPSYLFLYITGRKSNEQWSNCLYLVPK